MWGSARRGPTVTRPWRFPRAGPGHTAVVFGDQLGPHFLDDPDQPVLLVESRAVFARRRFHRQKAHLVLSAMRHRAAELGDQCRYVRADTYGEALDRGRRAAERLRADLVARPRLRARAAPGVRGARRPRVRDRAGGLRGVGRRPAARKRLLMEDFYRDAPAAARRAHGRRRAGRRPLEPRRTTTASRRRSRRPRRPSPEPWWPDEDEIDEEVRADLDRWERDGDVSFVGDDGPRLFPATRAEALRRLRTSSTHRLPALRPARGRDAAGDRVAGALAALGAAEPRPARPARGRAARRAAPTARRRGDPLVTASRASSAR